MEKKILIISQSMFEVTTNKICDWLTHYNIDYIRLNVDEVFNPELFHYDIDIKNNHFYLYDKRMQKQIDLSGIKIAWCRRFIYNFSDKFSYEEDFSYNSLLFSKFLTAEVNKFLHIIYRSFPNIQWFDSYKDILKIDKIEVLTIAQSIGLLIPDSYITNNYSYINKLLNDKNENLITKPLGETTGFREDKNDSGLYITYTQEVKSSVDFDFLPSLFQKKIIKKMEIRTFYNHGKCYSMAIFSSKNQKTKIDFRKYDWKYPNRSIPYQLPVDIEIKLDKLMKELSLTSGSLDILLDHNNNYYFLEVNPVGQFGMVSAPCNYNLEKEVVLSLIQKLNHEEI